MSDKSLAKTLRALGNPTRLALLRALRKPKALAEIEVASGEEEGRPNIARQAVSKHLDRLVATRLVLTRDAVREGRETVAFSLNHQTVFALAEEVRGLARLRPAMEPEVATAARASSSLASAKGPALVVAKGLEEGVAFDLAADGPREWVVGRRREADIVLDFDPYLSARNSLVTWDGHAHAVEDLGSRNGTLVNFRPLGAGERRALRHGDLVGVGRCLLLYWA